MGLSAGGSLLDYAAARQTAQMNNQALADWTRMQNAAQQAEWARQDAHREQASTAREASIAAFERPAQEQAQQDEATRLEGVYTEGTEAPAPTEPSRQAGQPTPGGSLYESEVASETARANTEALERIAAMAGLGSYNGGQNSLARQNMEHLRQSAIGIDAANNARQGSLAAHRAFQRIQPVQYGHRPSPLSGILSAAGPLLSFAGGAGAFDGLGLFGSNAVPGGISSPFRIGQMTGFQR